MNKKLFAISAFLFSICNFQIIAQDLTISSADFTGCEGSLNDSNPVGQYANNEDETLTICAGEGETIVNLYFIGFDIGTGDQLEIFDGDNLSAPPLGTFTGAQLQNENISSELGNCLTLHWTSDAEDVGDFSAIITCGPPCEHPIVSGILQGEQGNPLLICINESFTIDASSTQFLNNSTFQSANWNFGDNIGTANTWPTATYQFAEPGAYRISLVVTDNTGCTNLNLLDQIVFVSTNPIIELNTQPTVACIGDEFDFSASATPVTYSTVIEIDLGEPVYIPDAGTTSSDCFRDTVWVAGFPNLSVTEATDIDSLWASLEHTYLTDITIGFICPNGSVLQVYSQQGSCGNIDLGIPIAQDDGTPGVGAIYNWDPEVSSPTFEEACGDPNYNYDPIDGEGGTNLIAGDYAPQVSWDALIGCPFNGPWIIEVCDIVGADDGWIFNWGIVFNEIYESEPFVFTPSIGIGCDSTYLSSDLDFETINLNCDSAVMIPTQGGVYTVTYNIINDFGCTYSSDIVITAIEPPVMDAGDNAYFCGQPLQLDANMTNNIPNVPYTYNWSPSDPLNTPNAADPIITELNGAQEFIVNAFPTQFPNCIGADTVLVTIPSAPPLPNVTDAFYCFGEQTSIDVAVEGDYSYALYYPAIDATGLEGTNDHGNFFVDQPGVHFVTVTEPYCGFISQASFVAYPEVCEIKIPNVFSPNDDSKNEAFIIEGVENYPNSTLQVYDRWGKLVYESLSYNNSWTASDQADGTYYFIFGHNLRSGMVYYESHLTILRDKK